MKKTLAILATIIGTTMAAPAAQAQTPPGNPCAPKKKRLDKERSSPCAPKKKEDKK